MKRNGLRTLSLLGLVSVFIRIIPSIAGAVDPLATTEGVVNGALLPTDCSISASAPTLVGANVQATGLLQCSRARDSLVIQVCIQYRQPVVSEDVTWRELICGVPNKRDNATSVSGSASARCVPGQWAYRSYGVGEVHKRDQVTENGTGLAVSNTVAISCPIDNS